MGSWDTYYDPKPLTHVGAQSLGHNVRVKRFPDGSGEVLACSSAIFGFTGWEAEKPRKKARKGAQEAPDGPERAMRRARAQVKDLALCTPFKWFVTLTLDGARVDRYDIKAITRKLNNWLDNNVRRKGLCYVLVPERHKDGAIHFHGFFNDALAAVDSGTLTRDGWAKPRRPRGPAQREKWLAQGAHIVYNLPGWSLGFTTAIELYGDHHKAVGYVCKYIGKDTEKIGGRWYYSGGKLGHPELSYFDIPLSDVQTLPGAFTFSPEGSGLGFVMAQVGPDFFGEVSVDG